MHKISSKNSQASLKLILSQSFFPVPKIDEDNQKRADEDTQLDKNLQNEAFR